MPEMTKPLDVFIATIGQTAQTSAFALICNLRKAGLACDMDYLDRSIKAQMKHANKLQARYVAIIGEDEASEGKVMLKNMQDGTQQLIRADEVHNIIGERGE